MAISDTQKVDALWKKLIYGVTKTDTATAKSASNESIASPLLIRGDTIWNQADRIPTTATAVAGVVASYTDATSSTVQATMDPTSTANRTWETYVGGQLVGNWIPPEFGPQYTVKVYAATSGTINPQTAGTQLFPDGSGNNDSWEFDYKAGVLNFSDTNIPTAVTGKKIFISGYRYIGTIGISNNIAPNNSSTSLTVQTTATMGSAVINSGVNSTSTNSGALVVQGGVGVSQDVWIGGNLNVSGFINLTSTTATDFTANTGTFVNIAVSSTANSTSTTTGALVVTGGVGIGRDVNIGGVAYVNGAVVLTTATLTATNNVFVFNNGTNSTSTTTGAVVVNGGVGVSGNITVGGTIAMNNATVNGAVVVTTATLTTTNNLFSFTNTANSISTTTGAVTVTGGVGVGQNLNVGAQLAVLSAVNSTATSNGALTVAGGAGVAQNLNVGAQLSVGSSANSTGTANGALTVTGGAGIGQNLNVGGQITALASTNATSTLTGAVVVTGGVGVGQDLWVGGNIDVTGSLLPRGVSDIGSSTLGFGTQYVNRIVINSATNSVSTTTGALTVPGGVGIDKDVWIGGGLNVSNSIVPTSANANLGSTSSYFNTQYVNRIVIASTANSTSTTTGALVLTGGIGVGKNISVGGNISLVGDLVPTTLNSNLGSADYPFAGLYVSANTIFLGNSNLSSNNGILSTSGLLATTTTNSTSTTSGAIVAAGGLGIGGDVFVGGKLNMAGIGNSTSTTTGALVIAGGVGVGEDVYIGGVLNVVNNTTATSTTTGALTVAGGVGISGDLYVQGAVYSDNLRLVDSIFKSNQVVVNTTATVIIDSYDLTSFRSAKYVIQIDSGTGSGAQFQVIEILLLVDNNQQVYATEYGQVSTNGSLGEFASDVSGSTVNLYFTSDTATSKVISTVRTALVV